ncbi:MAG: peptide chain release factor N(5)-glutamine methyltransferase [Planctomycetota bacterium]|nr:peptide chain release factor N(5)-glutamine methyltransferase [Planctomycetota bacterium]
MVQVPGKWTTLALLSWTAEHFRKKGIENPRVNAEFLLAAAMGCERIRLYAGFETPVPQKALDRFREMVRRRANREPLQYIIGTANFRGVTLAVGPGVFIPRPETEDLVGAALERAGAIESDRIEAADIGTGCGCIAAALCMEDRRIRVLAADISDVALATAARNLGACGLLRPAAGGGRTAGTKAASEGPQLDVRCGGPAPPSGGGPPVEADPGPRAKLAQGDLFDAVSKTGAGPFHLIVSNPPYISREEAGSLQPEVIAHEPPEALFAGDGGFELIGKILKTAPDFLLPGGWVLVEIGERHGPRAIETMRAAGAYDTTEVLKDLYGKDRIAAARKRR